MTHPPFDEADALDRLGDDRELLREIAAIFLEDCRGQMEAIKSAIDTGSTDRLFKAAHALKGAAANLSAAAVTDAARRLEAIGRENRLVDAPAVWTELVIASDELAGALKRYCASAD